MANDMQEQKNNNNKTTALEQKLLEHQHSFVLMVVNDNTDTRHTIPHKPYSKPSLSQNLKNHVSQSMCYAA